MKRFALLFLILIVSSCSPWKFSNQVSKFDGEHISVAILELGPNYTVRTDSIVGRVYSWQDASFTNPRVDSTGQLTSSAYVDINYVHIFTNDDNTVVRTIYSAR
ncbi:MAG: hypothetical protein HWE14_13985 [Flavobacteriia bacterium]|nr:hypothetical protein [Flavobacteriia bacterium]